jgi:DNA processing protein
MNEKAHHCLALSLVPGLGTTRIHLLIQACGSLAHVFRLSPAQLVQFQLSEEARAFISSGGALRAGEEAARQAERQGIRILSVFDDEYPHPLKQIFDPPLVLYCLGDPSVLRRPAIAVVGSRRCSLYGREITGKITRELSSLGVCIVSGLARGIDAQAHRGALENGGTTVAVLGSGVDVIYPRENRRLYQRICERGCVISEFRCGSFPAPQNFPIRNRVISGLCYGTVIAEAAEFSGSLITARLTLEQNRELWAVPGNITSKGSYGPNYLIKQGAKILLDIQDVLEELPPYVLDLLNESEVPAPGLVESLTWDEEKIVNLLTSDASLHIDQLLNRSEFSLPLLNEVLLRLEMKGLIRQLPGRKFSRKTF